MSLDQINPEPDYVFRQLYNKYSLHIYYLKLKQNIIRDISQALTPMFCVYTCLQYYAIIAIIVECDSLHSVVVGRVTNQTLTKYGRLNCGLSIFFKNPVQVSVCSFLFFIRCVCNWLWWRLGPPQKKTLTSKMLNKVTSYVVFKLINPLNVALKEVVWTIRCSSQVCISDWSESKWTPLTDLWCKLNHENCDEKCSSTSFFSMTEKRRR